MSSSNLFLPPGVTQQQLEEVRAFNQSLTRGGQKSRPGRGRGSATRGPSLQRGSISNVGQGRQGRPVTSSGFGTQGSRWAAGSGVHHPPMQTYSVGPSTAPPTFKPASGNTCERSRSPTRVASTPASSMGMAAGGFAPRSSPPKMRESILVATGPVTAMPQVHGQTQVPLGSRGPSQPQSQYSQHHFSQGQTPRAQDTFTEASPFQGHLNGQGGSVGRAQGYFNSTQFGEEQGQAYSTHLSQSVSSQSQGRDGQPRFGASQPRGGVEQIQGLSSGQHYGQTSEDDELNRFLGKFDRLGMPSGQSQAQSLQPGPGRERIVSNMTPSDPSKPFIPAHLCQKSAYETIEHLAKMTGLSMEELTSDGVSIPGLPRAVRLAMANAATTTPGYSTLAAPTQVSMAPMVVNPLHTAQQTPVSSNNVDPGAWLSAYANKQNIKSGDARPGFTILNPTVVRPMSPDMDVDMEDDITPVPRKVYKVGTLADSRWAGESAQFGALGPAATPRFQAASTPTTPTTFGNNSSNGFNGRVPATKALDHVNVVARAQAEAKPGQKYGTLADSMWAN